MTLSTHDEDLHAYHNLTLEPMPEVQLLESSLRGYAWQLSNNDVQDWTQLPRLDAMAAVLDHTWAGITPVPSPNTRIFVNHMVHRRTASPASSWARLADAGTQKRRLQLGQDQWAAWRKAPNPTRMPITWLGSRAELESVHTFSADHLPWTVKHLGLYHFGKLSANNLDGVVRFVYELPPDIALFKPDWRHGYPNFYFAACPHIVESGRTRSLESGTLAAREWLVHNADIDPLKHLVQVDYVPLVGEHDFSALSSHYRSTAASALCAYRDNATPEAA